MDTRVDTNRFRSNLKNALLRRKDSQHGIGCYPVDHRRDWYRFVLI